MKIVLSADGRSPHTERWANAFASRGHDVILVWRSNLVDEAALGRYSAEIGHFATRPFGTSRRQPQPLEVLSPARLRTRIRPDIVQGMYLVDYGWTAAALGTPLVQFALGSDVLDLQPVPPGMSRRTLGLAYVRWRTARAVQRADAVLCDSPNVRRLLRAYVPRARVEILRIGVETRSDAGSRRPWRSDLGIADDAFVLLSTRLFTANYNILTIIRAFARTLETIPNSVLILKDLTSLGDDRYRADCRRLIAELGVGHAVRHVGELARPDLLALYRAADVFVTVPTNDATAVSLLEAMAARVPVVSSRTAGMDVAVLKDEDSALLVAPEDSVELADALLRLWNSPALRDVLARHGQKVVNALGDFEQSIAQAERLYVELIERG